MTAERVTIYYHAFGNFDKIQTIPLGLSVIARKYKWSCQGTSGNYDVSSFPIPDCGPNHKLNILVSFPQCWNGRDLSSPDFMSHMAYASNVYIKTISFFFYPFFFFFFLNCSFRLEQLSFQSSHFITKTSNENSLSPSRRTWYFFK